MTLLEDRWRLTPAVPDIMLDGGPIDSEEEFLASEVDRLTDALNLLAERHARLIGTLRGAVLLNDMNLVSQALVGLGFSPPAGADPYGLMDNPPTAAVLEQVNQ
jgi:hypothetical protein